MARACQIELGFSLDWDEMKRMLHFGNRAHLGAVAEFSNKRLDQALIAAWFPPAQLGLYVVAVNSTSVMLTLAQAMKITVLPQLARERERDRQTRALLDVFRRYWTLSLVASPVFALVLYWAIPLVYGEAYQGATWPALILVLGSLLFGAKDILSTGAKAIGDPWIGSKAELIALIVTLVLLVATIPTIGIVGAALTSVIAYSVSFLVVVRGISRATDLSSSRLLTLKLNSIRFSHSRVKSRDGAI